MVKDALIDCNTSHCAAGFHSMVESENSTEKEFYLRKWFMKLVFHKNPTKSMINLVKGYLKGSREVNLPAYYALSSMIHQYCRMSEEDCSRDGDILSAAIIFEDNLHDSCMPESEEDEKKILMSLKAIGNMGLIQNTSLLDSCDKDQNPSELRVAAIEAYRRAPCDVVPINRFMHIFSTNDYDSEFRIAGYRAVIRCPSNRLLQDIANIMITEPPNQVICYVSSHLNKLKNSPDPTLADFQTIMQRAPIGYLPKCGMEYGNLFQNYGYSYFDDESGNGFHFDSDVVFSSQSYLPRSARLSMNVDFYGYRLNLFEINARSEGWEEALEAMFTPGKEDREANMIQKLKWMVKERVITTLNKFKKKYESRHVPEQARSKKVAIALKILGNDVSYKDQDDFRHMAEIFGWKKIMKMMTFLAKHRTHEYTLNKMLKTSMVTIPTMGGMPLEVNIQGAFNSVLKASGKLDVMGMMAKPRRMAVQGLFEPSAAIEIHANMVVDVHCARSGLSHKTNLASSLSLGGSLSFENGMFKVKINAPRRRETIINASSSLHFMQMNKLVPVSEPEDVVFTVDETLSNPQYNLHISGRQPRAPFSLPEAFFYNWRTEVTLDKLEKSLVSYDLEAGFRTDTTCRNGEIEKTDHMYFVIRAQGSESIGVYSMDMAYHQSNMTLIINTGSPQESIFSIGCIRNEPKSKRFLLENTLFSKTTILEVGVDTIPLTNGIKFVPVFAISIPGFLSVTLAGHASHLGEKTVVDFTLVDNLGQKEIGAVKGEFIKNDTLHHLSLTVHSLPGFWYNLEGEYRIEETPSAVVITPLFILNTTHHAIDFLNLGGGPLVISREGVTINELYLAKDDKRLFEVSSVFINSTSCLMSFFLIDGDASFNTTVGYSVEITSSSFAFTPIFNHSILLPRYNVSLSISGEPLFISEERVTLELSLDYTFVSLDHSPVNGSYIALSGEIIKNSTLRLMSFSFYVIDGLAFSFKAGYRKDETSSAILIVPFFSKVSRADFYTSLSIKGEPLIILDGEIIKNSTLRLVSFSFYVIGGLAFSFEAGYRVDETLPAILIDPFFNYNVSGRDFYTTLSIEGGPLISSDGIFINSTSCLMSFFVNDGDARHYVTIGYSVEITASAITFTPIFRYDIITIVNFMPFFFSDDGLPLSNISRSISGEPLFISEERVTLESNLDFTFTEGDQSTVNGGAFIPGNYSVNGTLIAVSGEFVKNNTSSLVSFSFYYVEGLACSFEAWYRVDETSAILIDPSFICNVSLSNFNTTVSIEGGPLIISDGGVNLNDLHLLAVNPPALTLLYADLPHVILIGGSSLEINQESFFLQGVLLDAPFRVEGNMMNNEQYSVNITIHWPHRLTDSGDIEYEERSIRGLLLNIQSDFFYRLQVVTAVESTEYYKVTTDFKNEVNALQYVEATTEYKSEPLFWRKIGLQTQTLNGKMRYTPILDFVGYPLVLMFPLFMVPYFPIPTFLFPVIPECLQLEGSLDISESEISFNNIIYAGRYLERVGDGNVGKASLSCNTCSTLHAMAIAGYYNTSHHERHITFQTSATTDGSFDPPNWIFSFDLQTSYKKSEIFAWDGMVEIDAPRYPVVIFRIDTEYTLTPGHSHGDVFRLCYLVSHCNSTWNRFDLSHDLTFFRNHSNAMSGYDMEVTCTIPGTFIDATLELINTCTSNVSSVTHLMITNSEEELLATNVTYVHKGSPTTGFSYALISAPGYFEYDFTYIFYFIDFFIN